MAWKKQLFRYLQLLCYFRNCIVLVVWYLQLSSPERFKSSWFKLKHRLLSYCEELILTDATQQMSLPLVHLKTKVDTVSDTFCLGYETVKAMKHAGSVWERHAEEKVWN